MQQLNLSNALRQRTRWWGASLLAGLALVFCSASQAQVSLYSFSQTNGTYVPITGGTVLATATANTIAGSMDSQNFTVNFAPFSFTFNGTAYTSLNLNSNGHITFGATTPTTTLTTPISSTTAYAAAVAAWAGDINAIFNLGGFTGEIRWELVGSSPNQELVLQWMDFRPTFSTSATAAYRINFQIRLLENGNLVQVIYGPHGIALGAPTASGTRQVGLRGATNTDFNNRTNLTSVNFTASTAGGANSSTQAYNIVTTPPGMPNSGLTYTWTPPPPCSGTPNQGSLSPTTLAFTTCASPTTGTITASGVSSGLSGLSFQWEESADGLTGWVNAVGGSGATTLTYTPPFFTGVLYYRLKTICANGPTTAVTTNTCEVTGTQGTPNAGTIAPATLAITTCTPGSLTASGVTTGQVTYQWEQSPDGIGSWVNAVGGAGGTTATYTPPTFVGVRYYRLRTNCNGGGTNVTSNTSEVTGSAQCEFDVTYVTTGVSYTSIMPANGGSGLTYTYQSVGLAGDDRISNTVSLAGTNFTYQGQAVAGFQASTNGWMTFNTSNAVASFSNSLTSTSQNRVLAPFWDDLVPTGQADANLNASMRYQVFGTLGTGSAVIVIEWAGMERFNIPGPNMNFQVRLYEGSNIIEFVYGTFEGFNGTYNNSNTAWTSSYSIGYNGTSPGTVGASSRFAMQTGVTNHWATASDPANHVVMPECFSKFVLTPGSYTGPTSAPTIPAPANDNAGTAVVITPVVSPCTAYCGTYYTSRSGTNSGLGPNGCSTTAGNEDDDVWFRFTADGASTYQLRLRCSPNYDGVMQVLQSDATTPIACVNATAVGLIESYDLITPAAGDYFVRIFHNGAAIGTSGGQFSLCVNFFVPPPANDNICGAFDLPTAALCVPIAQSTTSATASPEAVCAGTADDDVWYTFLAETSTDTITVQGSAGFNAVLQVFSSADNTCTGALTSMSCTNATGTNGLEKYFVGPFTPGNRYFVRVYHFVGSGPFTICRTTPQPCTGTPNAGTASTASSTVCAGLTAVLNASGLSPQGPGITYQWEESPDGLTGWLPVVGGAGANTSSYTTTAITGTRYFRITTTCGNTAPPNNVNSSNVLTIGVVLCTYDVTYGPASWSSILPANGGSGNVFTWQGTSGDDNVSTTVSLAGTTFLYQGQPVTGIQASSNGFATFNTSNTSNNLTNNLASTTTNRVLAPFWDDLVMQGAAFAANGNIRWQVQGGALGSGTAVIVIEWGGMERFNVPGPNLNFQVRLYEGSNIIEFVYGNFEGFNGTYNNSNAPWAYSYSIGHNGANPAGTTAVDRFAMQTAVTNDWSASGDPTTHVVMPDCFSKFTLTPGLYTGGPVTVPAPANDSFASAQALTVNGGPCTTYCGTYYTSRNAVTVDGPASTCAGNTDDDVWFTFVATGTDDYTVTLRNSPGYNGDMEIFDPSSVSIVCQSATAVGLIETYNLGVVAAGTYSIRVFDNAVNFGGSGQFSICVNAFAPPPANDDICGAIGLTTNGTCLNTLGNIVTATASGAPTTCPSPGTHNPTNDVWYSFVAQTTNDQIRVQPLGTVNAAFQVVTSDDDLCTGALTSFACVNGFSTGVLETFSGPWTVGETYFIRVYHLSGGPASGSFNICITGTLPGCLTTSVPANAGTLCTTGGDAILSWTAVAGASGYDVYLDAGGAATTLVSNDQPGTTYNAGPLANGGYAWRVVPVNVIGEATGCTDRTFTVATAPAATITAGGPLSFCSPGSVLLTANNPVGSTRVWSPGGATTLSITATATGNYTVAVTVGSCTTTSAITSVTAGTAPVLSNVTATPPTICDEGATLLNASAAFAYCASTHTSGCSTDAVVLVELEELSQASGCSVGAYTDYTSSASASLLAGNIYTVDITMGSDPTQFAAAWIDYNADGDFGDVDEFLGASPDVDANGTASLTFEVPLAAANGNTRMRVIGGNDVAILGTQFCGASSSAFGETEDYTVIITGGSGTGITYSWTPVTLLDDPSSATPVASGVTPLPYTFTVSAQSGLGCSSTATVSVTLDLTDTDGDGVIDCVDTCPTVVGVEGGPCVLTPSPGYTSGHLEGCVCVPNACTQPVIIELRADPGHANEAGWEILDPNNFVICKGGYLDVAYGPNQIPQTDFCCLESGSYRLRVYDQAGDGFVSGGVTGGYQLREAAGGQRRIIDNFGNFKNLAGGPPDISAVSTTLDGGRFELPVGPVAPIFSSCDKLDWVNYQFIVASENAAVTGAFATFPATTGYEFWFFDPNGTYSYRRFRSHSTSDGFGSGATRACHFKINKNVPLPPGNQATNQEIPYNTLLNVRIRGRVNNANQSFGPACQFKIDPALAACPLVKLQDNPLNTSDYSCGVSKYFGGVTGAGNRITANPPQFSPAAPAGMVRYQFRFRIPGEIPAPGSCIVRPAQTSATLQLNWTTGDKLKCNTQYEVDVRVSKDGGASWCIDGVSPECSGVGYTAWGKICNVNITTSTFCPGPLQGGGSNSLALQGGGELTMYPNPNRGDQVFISLSEVAPEVNTVSVDIYDLSGKKVTTRAIAVQDGNVNTFLKLNGDLAAGMYMVNITAGDKTYTERLVIQP